MKIELKIKRLKETGEYRVGYYEDGVLNDDKSYYTDGREDAEDTMVAMQGEIDLQADEPEFVPGPEIEIESAYPEVERLRLVANEIIREYNHGTAEYSDCEGVTGKQYAAVLEDFLLYLNGVRFSEDKEHFEGWEEE